MFQYGSYDWRINYDDTIGQYDHRKLHGQRQVPTLTVVPEPTATALGLLALGGLLLRRRR